MPSLCRRALLPLLFGCMLPAQSKELRGRWSATDGRQTLSGTWTAYPATEADSCSGTWTVRNASGDTIATGTWAVRKDARAWRGRWAARTGDGRTLSGAWSAESRLPASADFADLLESALMDMISGTWQAAGRSGAWSIRTDVKK